MRVLILGGGGMLGHKLYQRYRDRFETWVTIRSGYQEYQQFEIFERERTVCGVNALAFDSAVRSFAEVKPDVAVNCIGVIKQVSTAGDPIISLTVNSLFPHRLANLCRSSGVRLIHISTDCVFSGRKGKYKEEDISDAEDLYGRTKFLGEVSALGCLTLRTSIIGRELSTTYGLTEWFLKHRGEKVRGYTRAIYSGFTTATLADIIADLLENHRNLTGLYHVSSDPISKHDLLCMMRDAFRLDIDVEPWPEVRIDRSLDSSRFRAATRFSPPSWRQMLQEMADNDAGYCGWRSTSHVR